VSNVLIGIIGVILFIGLALAGALILGDDFSTASASSKAAAVTAQLQQGTQGVTMFQLKTGRTMTAGEYNTQGSTLLTPRFLKIMPMNPSGGSAVFAQDITGSTTTGRAYILVATLPREAASKRICEAAAEAAGTTPGNASLSMQHKGIGCGFSPSDPLYYVIYANIF
jgi:hypothetical protein